MNQSNKKTQSTSTLQNWVNLKTIQGQKYNQNCLQPTLATKKTMDPRVPRLKIPEVTQLTQL